MSPRAHRGRRGRSGGERRRRPRPACGPLADARELIHDIGQPFPAFTSGPMSLNDPPPRSGRAPWRPCRAPRSPPRDVPGIVDGAQDRGGRAAFTYVGRLDRHLVAAGSPQCDAPRPAEIHADHLRAIGEGVRPPARNPPCLRVQPLARHSSGAPLAPSRHGPVSGPSADVTNSISTSSILGHRRQVGGHMCGRPGQPVTGIARAVHPLRAEAVGRRRGDVPSPFRGHEQDRPRAAAEARADMS